MLCNGVKIYDSNSLCHYKNDWPKDAGFCFGFRYILCEIVQKYLDEIFVAFLK